MTAIKFENISKQYRLGLVSTQTLSHDLNRWWQTSVRGKEDPYLKIGEVNDRAHKGESDYVWALKDIDFEVQQGDVLGIIGKNGAGKSTLLKILSKVTAPTTGTIRAAGRIASLLEVGTGFHPEMTGRENIFMNGAIMGMSKAEIKRKLDEIVDFSGVERYLDTPTKRYSSGMSVRLGFAIAAHLDPEILVVDEVLAVGDAEFQKKAIGKMQDISHGEGRTVIFVSHNMDAIKTLCNKGVILNNGNVDSIGEINSLVFKYLSEQEVKATDSISELKNRNGDGAFRVTDIKYSDESGNLKEIFEVGETLCIQVFFENDDTFANCFKSQLTLTINKDYSLESVAYLTSNVFIDKINTTKKSIIFKISKLMINEGSYNISLYCAYDDKVADWVQFVAPFKVEFMNFYKNNRIINKVNIDCLTDFIVES